MKQKRWTAILLAVSLAAAMTGCAPGVESCPAANQTQPGAAYETLAEATYPEMAKYPDETAYMKKDGSFDDDGFSKVYDAWWADKRARRDIDIDRENVQSFVRASTGAMLESGNGGNFVYSPLNVYMALSMLAECTGGDSRTQILSLLRENRLEDVRAQAKALWNANYCADGAVTSVLASSVCMDKAVANALFEANGVPHTKWVAANRWEIEKDLEGVCAGVEQKLGWPVFVKPANAGSSVGISKVSSQEELKAAIALALENDRKVVFEAFVDGQEVECAVIGSDPAVATRPGEILAGAEFYTYDDKYKNGVSQTVIPAHLPEAKLDEVKTYAAMAYTALNCEGLARCDFFVEKGTGRVLINEINTFPGFTSISMYPKLMEHEGLPVPQLIDRLIALALERKEKQHG